MTRSSIASTLLEPSAHTININPHQTECKPPQRPPQTNKALGRPTVHHIKITTAWIGFGFVPPFHSPQFRVPTGPTTGLGSFRTGAQRGPSEALAAHRLAERRREAARAAAAALPTGGDGGWQGCPARNWGECKLEPKRGSHFLEGLRGR